MNQTATQMNQLFDDEYDLKSAKQVRDTPEYINLRTGAGEEIRGVDPSRPIDEEMHTDIKNLIDLVRPTSPQEIGKLAGQAKDALTEEEYLKFLGLGALTAASAIPGSSFAEGVVKNAAKKYEKAFKLADKATTPEQWQDSIKEVVKKRRLEEETLGTSRYDPDVHTTKLEKSAQEFLADRDSWNRADHLALIDKFKPVTPWDTMPRTPTNKAVVFALEDKQRKNGFFFGLPDKVIKDLKVNKSPLKVGDKFNGRLDIPAYKAHDTWIVAGKSNQVTHYGKAMHYAPNERTGKVSFNASTKTGEKIAADQEGKIGYAIISGKIKDLDQDKIIQRATKIIKNKDPEWTQIGFDPRRQTHFYVREGENIHVPALDAEEVIQVGPLVLAKNVKLDPNFAGLNKGGGLMSNIYAST